MEVTSRPKRAKPAQMPIMPNALCSHKSYDVIDGTLITYNNVHVVGYTFAYVSHGGGEKGVELLAWCVQKDPTPLLSTDLDDIGSKNVDLIVGGNCEPVITTTGQSSIGGATSTSEPSMWAQLSISKNTKKRPNGSQSDSPNIVLCHYYPWVCNWNCLDFEGKEALFKLIKDNGISHYVLTDYYMKPRVCNTSGVFIFYPRLDSVLVNYYHPDKFISISSGSNYNTCMPSAVKQASIDYQIGKMLKNISQFDWYMYLDYTAELNYPVTSIVFKNVTNDNIHNYLSTHNCSIDCFNQILSRDVIQRLEPPLPVFTAKYSNKLLESRKLKLLRRQDFLNNIRDEGNIPSLPQQSQNSVTAEDISTNDISVTVETARPTSLAIPDGRTMPTGKTNTCHICGTLSSSQAASRAHYMRKHNKVEYHCPECLKKYGIFNYNFEQEHYRSHYWLAHQAKFEELHKCNYCFAYLPTRTQLLAHVKKHPPQHDLIATNFPLNYDRLFKI